MIFTILRLVVIPVAKIASKKGDCKNSGVNLVANLKFATRFLDFDDFLIGINLTGF